MQEMGFKSQFLHNRLSNQSDTLSLLEGPVIKDYIFEVKCDVASTTSTQSWKNFGG